MAGTVLHCSCKDINQGDVGEERNTYVKTQVLSYERIRSVCVRCIVATIFFVLRVVHWFL